MLYIAAKNINAIKIRFPKTVSNKFTNRLGIANIISHNTNNNDSNPTIKFTFLRENMVSKEYDIYINYIDFLFIIMKKAFKKGIIL